jgi:hypothetical protein
VKYEDDDAGMPASQEASRAKEGKAKIQEAPKRRIRAAEVIKVIAKMKHKQLRVRKA